MERPFNPGTIRKVVVRQVCILTSQQPVAPPFLNWFTRLRVGMSQFRFRPKTGFRSALWMLYLKYPCSIPRFSPSRHSDLECSCRLNGSNQMAATRRVQGRRSMCATYMSVRDCGTLYRTSSTCH